MGTVTSSHRLITREDALRQPEVNIPIPLENASTRNTLSTSQGTRDTILLSVFSLFYYTLLFSYSIFKIITIRSWIFVQIHIFMNTI